MEAAWEAFANVPVMAVLAAFLAVLTAKAALIVSLDGPQKT